MPSVVHTFVTFCFDEVQESFSTNIGKVECFMDTLYFDFVRRSFVFSHSFLCFFLSFSLSLSLSLSFSSNSYWLSRYYRIQYDDISSLRLLSFDYLSTISFPTPRIFVEHLQDKSVLVVVTFLS